MSLCVNTCVFCLFVTNRKASARVVQSLSIQIIITRARIPELRPSTRCAQHLTSAALKEPKAGPSSSIACPIAISLERTTSGHISVNCACISQTYFSSSARSSGNWLYERYCVVLLAYLSVYITYVKERERDTESLVLPL